MLIESPCLQHSKTIAFSNLKILDPLSSSPLPSWSKKMSSPKKLIKLARKWQQMVAIRRERISFPRTIGEVDADCCSTSSMVEKGHFVVYSADQRRFVLPLEYLKNQVVRELFELAEEEFGLPGNGPVVLPCDTVFMEYVISLIKRRATKDAQRAVLMFITNSRCSSSLCLHQQATTQQLPICSF